MATMLTQVFELNMIPGGVPPVVHVHQYDTGSRTLEAKLVNGNASFTIPSGSTVTLVGMKPSGKGFSYNAAATVTYSGGTARYGVQFDISKQMTVVAGKVRCAVVIKRSGSTLGSAIFDLDVEESPVQDETIVDSNEFTGLVDDAVASYLDASGMAVIRYDQAQTLTQQQMAQARANLGFVGTTDKTLEISDIPADAKAVGDRIKALEDATIETDNTLSIEGAAADAAASGVAIETAKAQIRELDGIEKTLAGITSDAVDVIINGRLAADLFVNYKQYNLSTGAVYNSTKGTITNPFLVKPGSQILLTGDLSIVFFNKNGAFVSSVAQTGSDQTVTVPDAAYKAGIMSANGYLKRSNTASSTNYLAKTNFFVESEIPKSETLHVDWQNVDGKETDTTLKISGMMADAKATGNALNRKLEYEIEWEGTSSENVDILFGTRNTQISTFDWINGEYVDANGAFVEKEVSCRTDYLLIKPGTRILTDTPGVRFFDMNKEYIGSCNNGIGITVTAPDNAFYVIFYVADRNSAGYVEERASRIRRDFKATGYKILNKDLHVLSDNVDGLVSIVNELKTEDKKRLHINLGFKATNSGTNSLGWNFKAADFTDHEYLDVKTGEVVAGTKGCHAEVLVKPGSSVTLDIFNVVFYNYYHDYLSYHASGIGTVITVPEDACYMGISHETYMVETHTSYIPERANKMMTNCRVSAVYLEYPDMHVNMSDSNFAQLSEFLGAGTGEVARVLTTKTIQAANRMRHAWRIASFNTYVGNRNRWTELKNFLQNYGIDIIGFQEVHTPAQANSSGLTFAEALSSWHLSRFAVIETEDVPTNCRPVAATSEFEVVSIEETKYTSQSNYGHRHFTKTQLKLPRWKDKKASENFMVSIYNTQLEVGTGGNNATRLSQVAELLSAAAADTNPFVIIMGDFNEMSVGLDTINAIKNAGFTPQLLDSSTPTAGRGFYDFIFVNERMTILDNDVVPYDLYNNISDHDLVFADIVFDYSNLISVKTSLPNCTLSGGGYWLDRRQTEPVVYTVTPNAGYTVQSIATGQGDNDLTYNNGAVMLNGNTVTIKPNLVVGDVWINVTTAAN